MTSRSSERLALRVVMRHYVLRRPTLRSGRSQIVSHPPRLPALANPSDTHTTYSPMDSMEVSFLEAILFFWWTTAYSYPTLWFPKSLESERLFILALTKCLYWCEKLISFSIATEFIFYGMKAFRIVIAFSSHLSDALFKISSNVMNTM